MDYKCIICKEKAEFLIKGTANAYCAEHAEEFFGDTSYLAKVEDEAKALKDIVDEYVDSQK